MTRSLVVAMLLALAGGAVAQPGRGGAKPGPNLDRREQVKKRIRAMRAYTLTEELSLDEATAGKLFPALAKYDDEFDKLLQQRADLQRRLANAGAMKDARAIDKLIDDAIANQRAFWEVEDKRLGELRKILSPHQTAKLLVVLPVLERKIQNQLRNAIQQGTGPRRKGGPPTAVEPGDDDLEQPFGQRK